MASFDVPASASILVLFRERPELARAFLRDLAPLTGQRHYLQLLLADAASGPATRNVLANCGLGSVQFFSANLGFACGNNRLAQAASGEILVFLNYDVQFTPGWLEELLAPFASRPELGIVGNVQLSVRARQVDHCGIFFDANGEPRHFRPDLAAIHNVPLLAAPAVTGACLAIRRSLFEKLGGFDEGYVNGYEDIDLCLRAHEAGARIAVATRSVIWHHIASSPGRHAREEENARRFASRWQTVASQLSRYSPPLLRASANAPNIPDPRERHQTLQTFFPTPEGFAEAASTYQLYPSERWTRVVVPIPPTATASGSVRVRLDPATETGRIAVGGVSLRTGSDQHLAWQAFGHRLKHCCTFAGTCRRVSDETGMTAESTGNDPQVILTLPARYAPHLRDGAASIHVWMRWERAQPNGARPLIRKHSRTGWRIWQRRPPPVRVAVDLSTLSPGGLNGGIKVFALALLREMSHRHRDELRFCLLLTPSVAAELSDSFGHCKVVRYTPSSAKDLEKLLADSDVLYAPVGFSRFSRPGLPQVSWIADVLHRDVPGALPEDEIAARERWMTESLAASEVLQCNSHFVVERLRHHYAIEPERTCVIHNATPRTFPPRQESTPGPPYFFYPANDWPHKNHLRLIEAFASYHSRSSHPWHLKLTGHFQHRDRLEGEVRQRKLDGFVEILGHVPDREYANLFRSAGALVLPSLYEGFGIPLVEAFLAGVPVLSSRAGSLPEVGGDACAYFDGCNPDDIAATMARVTADDEFRRSLIAAGARRAHLFSLEQAADRAAEILPRAGRNAIAC